MPDKRKEMIGFWSDRVAAFGSDPRANTNDIWLREVEIRAIEAVIDKCMPASVLDFGCANGFTTKRLAKEYPNVTFTGIDINPDMITAAKLAPDDAPNAAFRLADVASGEVQDRYDLIVAVRVFQNMPSLELQISNLDHLAGLLRPNGCLYFIESYASGYEQINADRERLALAPLPIHSHLTLLGDEFDRYAASVLDVIEASCPSSTYYLATRLLYSKFAAEENVPIDYNHPLHRLAAQLPQIGEYGPQKARLLRKTRTCGKPRGDER